MKRAERSCRRWRTVLPRRRAANLAVTVVAIWAVLVVAASVIASRTARADAAAVSPSASSAPQVGTAALRGSDPSLPATWTVEYPTVAFPSDPSVAAGITAQLKTLAQSLVDDFLAGVRTGIAQGRAPCSGPGSTNTLDAGSPSIPGFEVTLADSHVLSISERDYIANACSAHGTNFEHSWIFDLTTGRLIARDTLFKPGVDYPNILAGPAIGALQQEALNPPPDATAVVAALTNYPGEPGSTFDLRPDGLEIRFGQESIGPSAAGIIKVTLPYDGLAEVLNPRYLPGPPGVEQPTDPCTLADVSVKLHGDVGAMSAYAGGDATLEAAYQSDQSLNLTAKGKFRLGLQGVFGEDVHAGVAGQQAGLSDHVTVAGGLEVGAGATMSVPSAADLDRLSAAFRTGADPTGADATVTELYVEMGVWLTGDVGVTGPAGGVSGGFDVEGVIGAKLNFVQNQLEYSTYYFAVRGSLKGNLSLPAGNALPAGLPSAAAGLDVELVLGWTADLEDHPLKGSIEVTAGVDGSFDLGKELSTPGDLLKSLDAASAKGSVATGREVKFAVDLDLVDPANYGPWRAVLNGSNKPADQAALDDRLANAAEQSIVEYAVHKVSGEAKAKFGDGVAFGLGLSAEAEIKTAEAAVFIPPGGTPQLWTSCIGGASTVSQAQPASAGGTVSTNGTVGKLLLDRSKRDDVIATVGTPDAIAGGSFEVPGSPAYTAFGYQCSQRQTAGTRSLSYNPSPPYCRTVYYLDVSTGRVEAFWTGSATYQSARGTTVGMTAAEAQLREGTAVAAGCHEGIILGENPSEALVIINIPSASGASPEPSDMVHDLAAESNRKGVGLLFC